MSTIEMRFSVAKSPISPCDCVLLIGVPLTEYDFVRKLEGQIDGNFAQAVTRAKPNLAWLAYQRYIWLFSSIANSVEKLGVTVVRRATIDDLRSFIGKKVITLMSQWRSALFKEGDILDPHGLQNALSASESSLNLVLQRWNVVPNESIPEDKAGLARFLSHALAFGLTVSTGLGARSTFERQLYLRRKVLMAAAGKLVTGEAGIELADGFVGVKEIVASFPADFSGVIDLTVCNSILIAEEIRRRCGGGLVLANEEVVYPEFRLRIYKAVIELLSLRPQPYQDAVYRVRKELKRRLQ